MQKAVEQSDSHPLTKTMAPSKHGVLRRWVKGRVLQPLIRVVEIPHEMRDRSLLLLPADAVEGMGLDHPMADESDSSDGSNQGGVLVMLNRSPTISSTSILAVRALQWPGRCIGISPELIANLQGDYDADELNVWVLGQVSLRDLQQRAVPVLHPCAEVVQFESDGSRVTDVHERRDRSLLPGDTRLGHRHEPAHMLGLQGQRLRGRTHQRALCQPVQAARHRLHGDHTRRALQWRGPAILSPRQAGVLEGHSGPSWGRHSADEAGPVASGIERPRLGDVG